MLHVWNRLSEVTALNRPYHKLAPSFGLSVWVLSVMAIFQQPQAIVPEAGGSKLLSARPRRLLGGWNSD